MDIISERLVQDWHALLGVVPRLVAATLVLGAFFALGQVVGRLVSRFLGRGQLSRAHAAFFRNLAVWLVALVGLAPALEILGLGHIAAGLLAGGGVTAIVLGFAFRGIGENLLAGLFLAFSRPFEVGDLIESGTYQGQVRAVLMRYTHIRAADGRDIFVPSAQIFNEPLVNYTRDGLRRLSFKVGVDYSTDTAHARNLAQDALIEVKGILGEPAPVVSVAALGGSFIELEVAFWVDTFNKETNLFQVRTVAMENVRRGLLAQGVVVSSEVTTNLVMRVDRAVQVVLAGNPPASTA